MPAPGLTGITTLGVAMMWEERVTDFGTPEERKDALRIALACRELNEAIKSARFLVRVADLQPSAERSSELMVSIMERRTLILPTASGPLASEQCGGENG